MDIHEFYERFKNDNRVTIDSRTIEPGDLFFAFSGSNFNAATLAQDAVERGAAAVIVEQKEFEDVSNNIFYVPSTLQFLQNLASHHRATLKIPIIGLTGSNGKTTTKELISAVLAEKFKVQYTHGNLNNHIGVPLTLLSIKQNHEIAVVEMGANHQKEIELLCSIAQPDYGYITNFGKAHLEGFGGFEGVIKGKSELYDYLKASGKTILVNLEDDIQKLRTALHPKTITFGIQEGDFIFNRISRDHFVGISFNDETAISNLTGDYNFTNLCAAAALGLHFGIGFSKIKEAIERYHPTNMRSQVVEKNGKTLVLDTYNANPSSMAASLDNFSGFEGSKAIVIGDMLELGSESHLEHGQMMQRVLKAGFDEVYTVGPHFKEVNPHNAFSTAAELSEFLKLHPLTSKNVLLKGSRGIALEQIIDVL